MEYMQYLYGLEINFPAWRVFELLCKLEIFIHTDIVCILFVIFFSHVGHGWVKFCVKFAVTGKSLLNMTLQDSFKFFHYISETLIRLKTED